MCALNLNFSELKGQLVHDLIFDKNLVNSLIDTDLMNDLWKSIRKSGLQKWVLARPDAIYTHGVITFFANASYHDEERAIVSSVNNQTIRVTQKVLSTHFGLKDVGRAVAEVDSGLFPSYCKKWVHPSFADLSSPDSMQRLWMDPEYLVLLEIAKTVMCDDSGNFGGMTEETFRVMIALEEGEKVDWNAYIFQKLRDEVKKNETLASTGRFEGRLHMVVRLSYLLHELHPDIFSEGDPIQFSFIFLKNLVELRFATREALRRSRNKRIAPSFVEAEAIEPKRRRLMKQSAAKPSIEVKTGLSASSPDAPVEPTSTPEQTTEAVQVEETVYDDLENVAAITGLPLASTTSTVNMLNFADKMVSMMRKEAEEAVQKNCPGVIPIIIHDEVVRILFWMKWRAANVEVTRALVARYGWNFWLEEEAFCLGWLNKPNFSNCTMEELWVEARERVAPNAAQFGAASVDDDDDNDDSCRPNTDLPVASSQPTAQNRINQQSIANLNAVIADIINTMDKRGEMVEEEIRSRKEEMEAMRMQLIENTQTMKALSASLDKVRLEMESTTKTLGFFRDQFQNQSDTFQTILRLLQVDDGKKGGESERSRRRKEDERAGRKENAAIVKPSDEEPAEKEESEEDSHQPRTALLSTSFQPTAENKIDEQSTGPDVATKSAKAAVVTAPQVQNQRASCQPQQVRYQPSLLTCELSSGTSLHKLLNFVSGIL